MTPVRRGRLTVLLVQAFAGGAEMVMKYKTREFLLSLPPPICYSEKGGNMPKSAKSSML